jgi:hypothetical protein
MTLGETAGVSGNPGNVRAEGVWEASFCPWGTDKKAKTTQEKSLFQ